MLEALAELEMLEETELEPLLDFIIDKLLIGEYVIAEVGLGVFKGLFVLGIDSVLIDVIDNEFVGLLDWILVGEFVGLLEEVIILLGEFNGLLVLVLLDEIDSLLELETTKLSECIGEIETIGLFELDKVVETVILYIPESDISGLGLCVAIIDSVLIFDLDGILLGDTIGEILISLLGELYELIEIVEELEGIFDILIVLLTVIEADPELETESEFESNPELELINVLVIVGILEAEIVGDEIAEIVWVVEDVIVFKFDIELDDVDDTLSETILDLDTVAETEGNGLFELIELSDIVELCIVEILIEGEFEDVSKLVVDPDILILVEKVGLGEDDLDGVDVLEALVDEVIVFETLEVLVLVLLAVEQGDRVEVLVQVPLPVEETLTVLVLELVVVEDELTVDVELYDWIGLFEDETEIDGLSDNE